MDGQTSGIDFEVVFSEIKADFHLGQTDGEPVHGASCGFCTWMRDLQQSQGWDVMKLILAKPNQLDTLDLLLFMYIGIKIGRNQVMQEHLEGMMK